MSYDNGSVSGKVDSDEASGSFLSMAAPTLGDAMNGFKPSQITDGDSHDLIVLDYDAQSDRYKDRGVRWVVGDEAEGMTGMVRNTRDMSRFQSATYRVFVCAALVTAFPSCGRPLKEWTDRQRVIDRRWMTPVHMVASIAPGYYSQAPMMQEAAQGEYAFIDMRTNQLYCFRVESCSVVPESYGAFMTRLLDLERGRVVDSSERGILERLRVTVLDFGGRTTDWTTWHRRKLMKGMYGSADIGLYQYVEQIITDIMTEHPGKFASQPSVTDILNAMSTRKSLNQKIKLRARDGVQVDVTDIVDHNMRIMDLRFREVYESRLSTGQNTDVLLLAGGVARIVAPYLTIKHNRQAFISKDRRAQWMCNATGALLALIEEQQEIGA